MQGFCISLFKISKTVTKDKNKDFKVSLISLNEAYQVGLKLAQQIQKADTQPDAIVGIARGGMPPARFLCDFLNISTLYSIQIKHYSSGAEQKDEAKVLNKSFEEIGDKNILLVDDVNDSGKSLRSAYEQLEGAKTVKTAVLHEKDNTDFKADFVGKRFEEWRWLIYQWAAAEDILEFLKKDDMIDEDIDTIKKFLSDKYGLEVDNELLEQLKKFIPSYEKEN